MGTQILLLPRRFGLYLAGAPAGCRAAAHVFLKMAVAVSLTGIFLIGCVKESPVVSFPRPIQTIAVLPFDCEANNLDAPDILQRLVADMLKTGYQVSDIQTTNKFLENVGIVDGGQLAVVDPVKLGKDLGVQALLFGNVTNFGYANLGFYYQRKVGLELKLVEVATGETLWENAAESVTRKVPSNNNETGKTFIEGLADQLKDKLSKNPLAEESHLATLRALRNFPGLNLKNLQYRPKESLHFHGGSEKSFKINK
ncbi:MAG: hypothetical protein KCHDKBKB_01166 [Elusimicrobia bacterium]|nr:hypothetical protein [Elusimicrobiota bacterium]